MPLDQSSSRATSYNPRLSPETPSIENERARLIAACQPYLDMIKGEHRPDFFPAIPQPLVEESKGLLDNMGKAIESGLRRAGRKFLRREIPLTPERPIDIAENLEFADQLVVFVKRLTLKANEDASIERLEPEIAAIAPVYSYRPRPKDVEEYVDKTEQDYTRRRDRILDIMYKARFFSLSIMRKMLAFFKGDMSKVPFDIAILPDGSSHLITRYTYTRISSWALPQGENKPGLLYDFPDGEMYGDRFPETNQDGSEEITPSEAFFNQVGWLNSNIYQPLPEGEERFSPTTGDRHPVKGYIEINVFNVNTLEAKDLRKYREILGSQVEKPQAMRTRRLM